MAERYTNQAVASASDGYVVEIIPTPDIVTELKAELISEEALKAKIISETVLKLKLTEET